MARLSTAGAETRSPQAEGLGTVGTAGIDTSNQRSGGACYSFAPSGDNRVTYALSGVAGRVYSMRVGLRFSSVAPSVNSFVCAFRHSVTEIVAPTLHTDGTVSLWNNIAAVDVGTNSPALSANTYYLFEVQLSVPAAGNGTVSWRILNSDGTTFHTGATASSQNVGTSAIARVDFGHLTSGDTVVTVYGDDFAVNDDQGASQTGYPGQGKVYFLTPTSDSSNTGFTDQAGGTTNLYDAVDNTPPIGVSAPSAPTHQSTTGHSGNPTTSASVTLPTTAANDILILVGVNGGATAALTPGGTYSGGAWTSIASNSGTAQWGGVWWSRATGNHSGQTVTVGTATDSSSALVTRISGALTSASPIDTNTSNTNIAATGGALTGFSTTVDNALVVYAGAADDNIAWSAETMGGTNMAERGDVTSTGGADSGVMLSTLEQATAGATGSFAATHASSLSKTLVAFALKPEPPTAKTQIGSVNSNTTDNFEANLQSYTAAGIGGSDTVTLVQPLARGGNSSTTSRTAGVQATSNPVVAEATAALGTTAAGTEPTGWTTVPGSVSYAPAPTLGTGPKVKVRKGTASTDRMMFDLIGLVVEVVPSSAQSKTVTPATETDAAQALSKTKTIYKAVVAATEADAAIALSKSKPIRKTLTPAVTTNTAQALSATKPIHRTLGQALETDAAQVLSKTKTIRKTLGQAVETDVAVALSKTQIHRRTLGVALEADLAVALVFVKPIRKTLGQGLETDAAIALSKIKPIRKTLGQALEADLAVALVFVKPIHRTLGAGNETDLAVALVVTKPIHKSLGVTSEADATQALSKTQTHFRTLGPAVESDASVALVFVKPIQKTVGVGLEADSARPLAFTKTIFKVIGAATETDSARPLGVSGPIHVTLDPAAESDTASGLVVVKTILKAIAPAQEAAEAQALAYLKPIFATLSPASESDAAPPLVIVHDHLATLSPASEASEAVPLTWYTAGVVDIAPAGESDAAMPLTYARVFVGPEGFGGLFTAGHAGRGTGRWRGRSPIRSSGTPTGGKTGN